MWRSRVTRAESLKWHPRCRVQTRERCVSSTLCVWWRKRRALSDAMSAPERCRWWRCTESASEREPIITCGRKGDEARGVRLQSQFRVQRESSQEMRPQRGVAEENAVCVNRKREREECYHHGNLSERWESERCVPPRCVWCNS